MNNERKLLINSFIKHKRTFEDALKLTILRIPKVSDLSEKARREGNALYVKGNHNPVTHKEIFGHYCNSVALAPNDSEELALAYGNRSAFLLHIKKYKESIQDIDRALSITSSASLKVKLLCRKVECLKALGSLEYRNILKMVQSCVDEINEKERNQLGLDKLVDKAKTDVVWYKHNMDKEDVTEKTEILKKLSKKETDDVLKSVSLQYNEKYKRHLVAARDFQPGEIILVDKLYATILNYTKRYTNCYYCLKTIWSGIPCDYCSWAMFCCEKCKVDAWEKYHDIECSVVPRITMFGASNDVMHDFHICLRILITGIRQVGGVAKLRDELKLIDKCTDPCYKGFLKNGKFTSNTFQNVYSLESRGMPELLLEMYAEMTLFIMIPLVKYTSLLGKNFGLKKIDDLINNEDIVFLGSLLIKLFVIKNFNSYSFTTLSYTSEQYTLRDIYETNKCCARGTCLGTLNNLINHSCFPNVARCFTEDQKIIIYAVQPIQKNSQIFDSYGCTFSSLPIFERQKYLRSYRFTCDCTPCIKNWPPILQNAKELKRKLKATTRNCIEIKLCNVYRKIFKAVNDENPQINEKTVNTLSKAITKSLKHLTQPSEITCLLISVLEDVFIHKYGYKHESFGWC